MKFLSRIWASAMATSWLAPMAAAVVSITLYERNARLPGNVLDWGIGTALVFWLMIAVAYYPKTSPKYANSRSYWLLRDRIDGLRARQIRVCQSTSAHESCNQAKSGIQVADAMLEETGFPWVSQRGYIAVWQKVHRAEEALIEAEGKDDLLEDAEHDLLRLKDSKIPQKGELLELVKAAKVALAKGDGAQALQTARKALKEVRCNVNVFRDDLWNGLVGLRNQTLSTLVLTELAGFAILGVAILSGADPKAVGAGAIYFLVGAALGLFNRLYAESQADQAVDDYGLATARVLTLPAYGGLAGVGGVLLTSLTSGQPTASTLGAAFDFVNHPLVLIAAGAFGLAPALLVEGLSKQGRQYLSAIKSTEAGQDGSQTGAASGT